MSKLDKGFFQHDVLDVAPDLLGKKIVTSNGKLLNEFVITDVEAYRGEEDKACHAHKGRTKRTEVMYSSGGLVYVYLIYGMYWMLNIVTGNENFPQAILIRAVQGCNGPGRVGRLLNIDKSYYGENLMLSNRIWIADTGQTMHYTCSPRIGIDYADEIWRNKPWRFSVNEIQ